MTIGTKFEPLGVEEIKKILPHRFPFLFIDRVTHFDEEGAKLIAIKNLTVNEPFFQGHFPEAPVMPGVLMIEAMAQAGGVMAHLLGYKKDIAVLLRVSNAKFRNKVVPGDTLFLHMEGKHISAIGGKVLGTAKVNDEVVCEVEISFAFVSKETLNK